MIGSWIKIFWKIEKLLRPALLIILPRFRADKRTTRLKRDLEGNSLRGVEADTETSQTSRVVKRPKADFRYETGCSGRAAGLGQAHGRFLHRGPIFDQPVAAR